MPVAYENLLKRMISKQNPSRLVFVWYTRSMAIQPAFDLEDPEVIHALLTLWADPDQSLRTIAAHFNTSPFAIARALARPHIREQISLYEQATSLRARMIHQRAQTAAILAMTRVLERFSNDDAIPAESAIRAAAVTLRLTNPIRANRADVPFAPAPATPDLHQQDPIAHTPEAHDIPPRHSPLRQTTPVASDQPLHSADNSTEDGDLGELSAEDTMELAIPILKRRGFSPDQIDQIYQQFAANFSNHDQDSCAPLDPAPAPHLATASP